MILMRETTPATMLARDPRRVAEDAVDAVAHARASPSTGSKWMSEAPCSTPWPMSECTSLMTGASSADSRRSTTSAPSSSSIGLGDEDLVERVQALR